MTAEACREWRESLGAYVLGQLPADEHAATSAHVEGCAACRAEVEALAPLAELLPKADPARVATAPTPPPELADRVAARIGLEGRRRKAKRRRVTAGLAAAAASAAAALILAFLIFEPGTGGDNSQTVAFRSLPPGVAIAATVQPRPFGTEIRMEVSGMRSGTLCHVALRRADGTLMPAGSFRYRYGGSDEAVLTSALDLSAARSLRVRAGEHTFVAPLRSGVGAAAPSNLKSTEEEYS